MFESNPMTFDDNQINLDFGIDYLYKKKYLFSNIFAKYWKQ